MYPNNPDSLFFAATDIYVKSFAVNKKYIVSVRDVNSIQTEIKTSLGDVFTTKDFATSFIINLLSSVEHKNEEAKKI